MALIEVAQGAWGSPIYGSTPKRCCNAHVTVAEEATDSRLRQAGTPPRRRLRSTVCWTSTLRCRARGEWLRQRSRGSAPESPLLGGCGPRAAPSQEERARRGRRLRHSCAPLHASAGATFRPRRPVRPVPPNGGVCAVLPNLNSDRVRRVSNRPDVLYCSRHNER